MNRPLYFGDSGTGQSGAGTERGTDSERIRGGDMPISTPYPIPKHFQKKSPYPIQSPNRSPYCRSVRIGDRIGFGRGG